MIFAKRACLGYMIMVSGLGMCQAIARPCDRNILRCASAVDLEESPLFLPTLHRFLGERKEALIDPNETVSGQVGDIMSGPPDQAQTLPDGSKLFSACRAHGCFDKAALIVDRNRKILVVGVLHSDCAKSSPPGCEFNNIVTIYAARDAKLQIETIQDWFEKIAFDGGFAADLTYEIWYKSSKNPYIWIR